jgi:hypothetical protein
MCRKKREKREDEREMGRGRVWQSGGVERGKRKVQKTGKGTK